MKEIPKQSLDLSRCVGERALHQKKLYHNLKRYALVRHIEQDICLKVIQARVHPVRLLWVLRLKNFATKSMIGVLQMKKQTLTLLNPIVTYNGKKQL